MSLGLIVSLMFIAYITIGITFMGMLPDSKGEPNYSLIFLWPISILCFVSYAILFVSYKIGKIIRKKLIGIYSKKKSNKSTNKEDRCDQIIKEILEYWDD